MTSVFSEARRLLTRSGDLGARVAGLESAVAPARGRLSDATVDRAEEVVNRASSRMRLSSEHTVVALAGATGSGKSSTFNALTGIDISAVGVRRPTTSWATACVWGTDGAQELLDWLGIPPRHQVTRDSMLSTGREDKRLQGTVLLDLPDHDSTEVHHHLEVDRLVKLADMLVWVLDPQKYADAAIHDRYLRPLADHAGVMVVVLNHIDTVAPERRASMLDDVRRLLAADGLADVPVIGISAREGIGIDDLKDEISRRVAGKKSTKQRFVADVASAATDMRAESGTAAPRKSATDARDGVVDSFAEAAGVPTVVKAVEDSTRMRATRATGWPVTSWFSKLRPDPLKRLHLDLGKDAKQYTGASRTSMPEPTQVQRARMDSSVRGLADDLGEGLHRPWKDAIRRASVSRLDDVGDRLDQTLSRTDLGATGLPWWAKLVRVLQWILILTAMVGLVWLVAIFVVAWLQLPDLPTADVSGIPIPTVLLLGGVLLGVLLALVCRFLVASTARSRARTADKRLRAGIREVVDEMVVAPVDAELEAYRHVRDGLAAALD